MYKISTVHVKTVSCITETELFSIDHTATVYSVASTTAEVLPTVTVYSLRVVKTCTQSRHNFNAVVYFCIIAATTVFFLGYHYNVLFIDEKLY